MVAVKDRRVGQIYNAPDMNNSLYLCKAISVADPELRGFGKFAMLSGFKTRWIYTTTEQWLFLTKPRLPKAASISLRKIVRSIWKVKWDGAP